MKKIKIIATVLCALLVLTALCSCMPTNNETEWVEEGATKIRIYAREFESWAKKHLKKLVNDFNSDLTDGIQVEVNFYTQDTYADALTVARENGKAPDLYMTTYGELYTNINNKYCASLNDYLSDEAVDDMLDTCKELVTYNDNIYAYPWNLEPGSILFYRKDVLENAGVTKVPSSWDELYDACAKIKATLNRGQYCIGMPLGSGELTWVTYGLQQTPRADLPSMKAGLKVVWTIKDLKTLPKCFITFTAMTTLPHRRSLPKVIPIL